MSTEGGALPHPHMNPQASRLVGMRRILGAVFAALLLTTTACAAELPELAETSSSAPVGTDTSAGATIPASTAPTEPPVFVPDPLTGLETQSITVVDGNIIWLLTVAVADTAAERTRGLMNVADLGDLEGMLFVWEEPTSTDFWMENVILPLDIAFFGEDLTLVDSFTMPLCTTDPCPSYLAAGPFKYAVEVVADTFTELTPEATLILSP
jgi:uncharacterized membrane protein (UPF0127 family)